MLLLLLFANDFSFDIESLKDELLDELDDEDEDEEGGDVDANDLISLFDELMNGLNNFD